MKLKEAINKFEYLSEEKREKDCSLFPIKGGSQFQVYRPNTASDDLMHYIFPSDNQEVRERNINTAKNVISNKVSFPMPVINNDTDFGSTAGTMDVFNAMAMAIMYEYLSQKLKEVDALKNKSLEDIIKDKTSKYAGISESIKEEKRAVKETYDNFYGKLDEIGKIIEEKNKTPEKPKKEKITKKEEKISKERTPKEKALKEKKEPKTNTEKLDEIKSNFITIMTEYHNKTIDNKKKDADDVLGKLADLQTAANSIDADDDAFQKKIDSLNDKIQKSVDEIDNETKNDAGSKLEAAVQAAAKNLNKNKEQKEQKTTQEETPKKKMTIKGKTSSDNKTGKINFAEYGFDDED